MASVAGEGRRFSFIGPCHLFIAFIQLLRKWQPPWIDDLGGTRVSSPGSGPPPEYRPPSPMSVEREAMVRLRQAAVVSLIAEVILPAVEAAFFARPDWLAVEIQAIWLGFTVALLAGTWHPRFVRVWKPAVLLFATALIVSSGILSLQGATLAPFMFLLVLLPVGGICLPWATGWQTALNALCLAFGLLFSSQFDWQNHLVISGLSAMLVSILGAHFVSLALTRQRTSIHLYLQALARSEAKFRKIFETSGSVMTIYSLPDGRILDVNPAWERIFGYQRSEVIGQTPARLGMTDSFVRWLRSLKLGETGIEQQPSVFRGRGNNPIYCIYSWSTLELNNRECLLVVGQDVTARVQAEEELRRQREVLLNQERLRAVGELASGIAHDLNNSLNALRLRVELLDTDPKLAAHRDTLRLISRMVDDAGATVGRLQDFARGRHERPVDSLDLGAIVQQSVEIARSTVEERNSLLGKPMRIEVGLPQLPFIYGEPAELRQIFLNLLLNARDAMPAGGTIRVAGQVRPGAVAITVEDEGEGIPQEHLQRVFDPFFTTKGDDGTGLGLSIASRTMARLDGSITAANRSQGGAVFTLTFPLARTATAHSQRCICARVSPCRVMVIDDDPANLLALRDVLTAKGHSVITACPGAPVLDDLMGGSLLVDVVLCDLGMPQLDGWAIARRMRSLQAPPLFCLVTGWAPDIAADDPRRQLVDLIMAKPIDPRALERLLAEAARRHPTGVPPPGKVLAPDDGFEPSRATVSEASPPRLLS